MAVTPMDMLRYVKEIEGEVQFLTRLASVKNHYTIGEITDRRFEQKAGEFYLISPTYHLELKMVDQDIFTALQNGQYVTAFLSRKENAAQVHFLVHTYKAAEKSAYEDAILQEVIDYMILHTIIALRLDTKEKIQQYIG